MALKIKNLSEFNKELKKVMDNVEKGSRKVLVKGSIDTLRQLQIRTPRETSYAAAGWNTTVDSNASEWKPPPAPPPEKKNYPLTPFKGEQKIKLGSTIHISNNTEYIIPLDNGHSKRAKSGIVDFVLAKMIIQFKRLTKKESNRKIK